MPGKRREIERQLQKLPESFTVEQIKEMHSLLAADVSRGGILEAELHRKHKTLAYSYPSLFFKTVRGEMDPHIFDTLMKLKQKVDDGEINNKRAKELVIDGARRHVEGEAPRVPKLKPAQGSKANVQEINLKCKVDEEEDD